MSLAHNTRTCHFGHNMDKRTYTHQVRCHINRTEHFPQYLELESHQSGPMIWFKYIKTIYLYFLISLYLIIKLCGLDRSLYDITM